MIAGNSWGQVICPICNQKNIIPYDEPNKVSEWERILGILYLYIYRNEIF